MKNGRGDPLLFCFSPGGEVRKKTLTRFRIICPTARGAHKSALPRSCESRHQREMTLRVNSPFGIPLVNTAR